MATTPRGGAPRRPRGRPRDDALTARALSVTLDLLVERGWAGLGVEAIAGRTRAGKAALYRRWNTVGEVVRAALTAHPIAVVVPADAPTVAEALDGLLESWQQPLTHRELAAAAVLGSLHTDPDLAAAVQAAVEEPLSRAVAVLADVARRSGRPLEPARLRLLSTVLHALYRQRLASGSGRRHHHPPDVLGVLSTVLLGGDAPVPITGGTVAGA
ncbi:TetR/AcrR family transcriptional regulator [Geodermatophilus nigrescens]